MGYSSVRTDPSEKLFSRQELLQNILLLTSIILCLIALANFSICIWIRYVKAKLGHKGKKELAVCHISKLISIFCNLLTRTLLKVLISDTEL